MSDHDEAMAADAIHDARLMDLLYADGPGTDELRAELSDEDQGSLSAYGEIRQLYSAVPAQDPPARLSAQLLAAASAEVAIPREDTVERESRGFWARLMRPFIVNPAFAAAAGLVVVVGTIGLLYSRGEHRVAEPSLASSPSVDTSPRQSAAPPAAAEGVAPGVETDKADGLDVGDLSQGFEESKPAAPRPAPEPQGPSGRKRETGKSERKAARDLFGRDDDALGDNLDRGIKETATRARGGVAGSGQAQGGSSPVTTSSKAPTAPEAKGADKNVYGGESANLKRLHNLAVREAKAGRCEKVRPLLARIRALDESYYNSNCKTNRVLQDCLRAGKRNTRPVKKPGSKKIPQSL